MQGNQLQSTWKSSDLSLVASLLATRKASLVRLAAVSPFRCEFYLSPSNVCQQLATDYVNDRLLVSAKSISDNVRLLKNLMQEQSLRSAG